MWNKCKARSIAQSELVKFLHANNKKKNIITVNINSQLNENPPKFSLIL